MAALLAVWVFVWAGVAQGAPAAAEADAESGVSALGTPLAYETQFAGVKNDDLRELLIASSDLKTLQKKPPLSVVGLTRRAESDADRLREVLHSEGYYAGVVTVQIDPAKKPVHVVVNVTPGPLYKMADFTIIWTGCGEHCPEKPKPDALGVKQGAPGLARTVVTAEAKLLQQLHNSGHPFGRVAERHAVVDHDQRTLSVTETIDPGPAARYGPLSFQGELKVRQSYIRRLMPWQEGDVYKQNQVDDFQRTLAGTGLFKTAVVEPAASRPAPDGTLPMRVTLVPAKTRTVGAGLNYSTTDGPGGSVFWEHRNLFGNAEDFRAALRGSRLTRALDLTLAKPQFRRRDQTLKGAFTIEDTDTDAYDERGIESQIALERPLWPHWKGSIGPSLTLAKIRDKNTESVTDRPVPVMLVGLPVKLSQDSSDNLLDPTKGTRLAFSITPEGGTIDGTGVGYVRNEAIGSGYYTLGTLPAFTMAVRGRIGSIMGAKAASLPANRRFYAGGGGSVRGYKYQRVGPLNDDNRPLGGRSVVEVSTELRIRITQTIGIVPFVDGGQVYDTGYPEFSSGNLQWAGGLGLRYFSPVGPLRVDVARPLNPRSNDKAFQFYISIGQAF